MTHRLNIIKAIIIGGLLFSGCYKEEFVVATEDWTTASHSSEATPDYTIVFDDSQVNRFDIVIDADDWKAMQKDLENVVGGTTGGQGGGGGATFSEDTPEYFPCDLTFNGLEWPHVGIRYKGNSSLSAYSSGANKLPLRLEFDEFENDYPEISDMRFYGFKELSLSSNFDDPSLLREKVAPDLFRAFGVPAPRTAFYEIYIDHGDGPVYFGVYTAIEVVFDAPMLTSQFDDATGNCYKPDGDGAAFSTSNFDLDDIEIKNHFYSDKSEIEEFYNILHSADRTSNPSTWRTNLESVFDVQGYLKYLAVNNTIQNWDTYGNMTHNYYLYHDPSDGLIKWIPWDHNEAFVEGKREGTLSFGMTEVNNDAWPIITHITDDAEYKSTYVDYLEEFITTIFYTANMTSIYQTQESIVESSAAKETSDYSFLTNGSISSAVNSLINHASSRNEAALVYIDSQ